MSKQDLIIELLRDIKSQLNSEFHDAPITSKCPKCQLDLQNTMGYVCGDKDCPCDLNRPS